MEQNTGALAAVRAPSPGRPLWVVFRCGRRRFVAPLEQVREILPPFPLTRIPGCGVEVCGLIGLRGRVITVFDLGSALGVSRSAGTADHRLLIVEHGERVFGLVVEEVVAVAPGRREAEAPDTRSLDLRVGESMGSWLVDGEKHLGLRLDRIAGRLLGWTSFR